MQQRLMRRGSDVVYTSINYVFRLVLKPLLLLSIPLFLTEIEQGYWYTFTSLAALTTFADLGFTSIVSQFAAHETAVLKYKDGVYSGDTGRLVSLFQTMQSWVLKAMLIITPIISIIGFMVMGKENNFYSFVLPWIIYAFSNSVNFYIQAILSFFEGCNRISDVQKIKCLDAIIVNIMAVFLLAMGFGTYALGISMIFACFIDYFFFKKTFRELLKLLKNSYRKKIDWIKEILPLLKRYAIGWICNYLTFQIYNPLTFRLFGAEISGKVGYTITIVSSIYSLSNVWMYVVTPSINAMAERKEWKGMDHLLQINMPLSAVTFFCGTVAFSLLLNIPLINGLLAGRILSMKQFIILSSAYFIQIGINGMAIYLRAHKKEPLLYVGIVSAISSISLTIILLVKAGINYIFEGYLLSFLFTVPITISIFVKRRKEWHQ